MTARLVMTQRQIDADRAAWLAARLEGLTASEMASVLGIAPGKYGSPFALYHAKVDGVETNDSDAMMRGRVLEPYVADRLAAEQPWLVQAGGGLYRHATIDWLMATFDRLAIDSRSASPFAVDLWNEPDILPADFDASSFPVQIKTAGGYDGWGDEGEDTTIPVHYRAQCLIEMEVWGADVIWIPVLFMVPWKLRLYRIGRDDPAVRSDIDLMLTRGEQFRSRLERRQPPPVDWTPATTATLRALAPGIVERTAEVPVSFARRVVAARKAKRKAERRLALLNNQLMQRMGDAHHAGVSGSGDRLATRIISDARVQAFDRHSDYLRPGKWGAEPKNDQEEPK